MQFSFIIQHIQYISHEGTKLLPQHCFVSDNFVVLSSGHMAEFTHYPPAAYNLSTKLCTY